VACLKHFIPALVKHGRDEMADIGFILHDQDDGGDRVCGRTDGSGLRVVRGRFRPPFCQKHAGERDSDIVHGAIPESIEADPVDGSRQLTTDSKMHQGPIADVASALRDRRGRATRVAGGPRKVVHKV
jgi:hypothetical protein